MLGKNLGKGAKRVAPKRNKQPTVSSYGGGNPFQEAAAKNEKRVSRMKKKR